ncbi:MAG: UPF0280 family protein [Candidatus Melainabacteria bacterium HGW-Melainabacteria-1]|nr:MAG: UPF0280 family protein [Candidatus Melainabacteria bacterium HGW-Melainabacteria-1]
MEGLARKTLLEARAELESYGASHPGPSGFFASLEPLENDVSAPRLISTMLAAARTTATGKSPGVGPMAAVAGAVAEHVGRALQDAFYCAEIIVENGGDLWLAFARPLEIAVFAGDSPLSGLIGVEIDPELSPCGLCTSSGTTGPSLSFGYADAAVALCRDAAKADAWATSLGNMIQSAADIEPTLEQLREAKELLGALIIVGDRMGIRGQFRLKLLKKA